MLGAILGEYVGSRFEFDNIRTKDFDFFHPDCRVTDDSIMTIAVMKTILESDVTDETAYKKALIANFQKMYKEFPDAGYGLGFREWLRSDVPKPYNSYGNGACMRVSPCSVVGKWIPGNRADVTRWTTEVSHNHPFALAWAEFLTSCIQELWELRDNNDCALDHLRERYANTKSEGEWAKYYESADCSAVKGEFNETCQGTMPLAIEAVLNAQDTEDAVQNAVSYGGDSDTIAAIAGSLAEPIFGIYNTTRRKMTRIIPISCISTEEE